ncbi:hypothetical protein NDU88_000468 [Pleurodeles waltl]|uniref:Uncharacterized protein n=1 Tax=Pleurodeles waltl TaxID=8319 RepID=A0AAV7SX35_PLEWA|nr:hypothetical protein NDU88_000468 [Pleurodeles waltl]
MWESRRCTTQEAFLNAYGPERDSLLAVRMSCPRQGSADEAAHLRRQWARQPRGLRAQSCLVGSALPALSHRPHGVSPGRACKAQALMCCCQSEAKALRSHPCWPSSLSREDDAPSSACELPMGPASVWRPSEEAGCHCR